MTAHSPGPWRWKHFMEVLLDAQGNDVITFMPYADKGWTSEADARLIAAAPELLASLKWAIRILDATSPCDDACAETCSQHKARALIARIEGASE